MSGPGPNIRPEAVARAVFDRLAPLVPREIDFQISGAEIRLTDRNGVSSETDCRSFFNDGVETVEAASTALLAVLSQVQDFVTEFLTDPWPPTPPESPGLAPPDVVVRGEGIRLLYGPPSDPLIELPFVEWKELRD